MRLQAQALREAAIVSRELLQNARDARRALKPADYRTPARPYQPQNKAFREWRTFRDHMQRLERTVRRDHHLGPTDEVSKEMVCTEGGLVAKTVTRIMTRTFGLASDHWPPSTWPADLPRNGREDKI